MHLLYLTVSKNMPLLSIIVVTWNNENYIEQALRSCIVDGLDGYEVIVVHNASDDRTGDLIGRAIAVRPALFSVVENERNEGLGEGRNIGLQHASGRYVMFLDGDDWYEAGAIDSIVDLIRRTNPDVLVFNYQRVWGDGRRRQNILTNLLHERDASLPSEREPLLKNFCSAWNKAYRRSFIERIGACFPGGYYEDVTWNYQILFKADTCYAVPDVFVNYRQRDGSILKSTSNKHLALLERYRDLLDLMRKEPEYIHRYGATMYLQAKSHLFNQEVWLRMPKAARSKYLREAAVLLGQWRMVTSISDHDLLVKVAAGGIVPCNLVVALRKRRRGIRKALDRMFARAKQWTLVHKVVTGLYDNIFCRLPINPCRVYLDSYWGKKVACNPLAIAMRLHEIGGYDIVFGIRSGTEVPPDVPFRTVRISSLAYWLTVATSAYLVSNVNLVNGVKKRKGAVFVETHHGTPIKVMGLDIRRYNPKEMNWRAFQSRTSIWDYVISSNPYSSAAWRRAMPYDYKIIEAGYPRNDILFAYEEDDVARVRAAIGVPEGKKVAMYAPTIRDVDKRRKYSTELPLEDMAEALGDDYILLARSHYLTRGSNTRKGDKVIDVSAYPATNELCYITDLLITDYSSIMFDYACLKRPIVLFVYDYDEYTERRGVYMDVRQQSPGPIAQTVEELVEILHTCAFESEENRQRLLAFNATFCPWDDGHASDRVIDAVFCGSVQGPTKA